MMIYDYIQSYLTIYVNIIIIKNKNIIFLQQEKKRGGIIVCPAKILKKDCCLNLLSQNNRMW